MSREDFHGLAAEIRRGNPTIGQIMPGAWVGPITLKTRGKLTDVIWDATTPFFSRGLIAAIRQAGAMLHPEPVTVVHRGKPVRGYYYCRPALVELWDPKTLLRFYDRCAVCGGIRQRKGVSAVAANHGRVYRRVKWPGREGMVYSYEHMDHLFSDEFVNVATQGGFVGLSFERVGRWC